MGHKPRIIDDDLMEYLCKKSSNECLPDISKEHRIGEQLKESLEEFSNILELLNGDIISSLPDTIRQEEKDFGQSLETITAIFYLIAKKEGEDPIRALERGIELSENISNPFSQYVKINTICQIDKSYSELSTDNILKEIDSSGPISFVNEAGMLGFMTFGEYDHSNSQLPIRLTDEFPGTMDDVLERLETDTGVFEGKYMTLSKVDANRGQLVIQSAPNHNPQ